MLEEGDDEVNQAVEVDVKGGMQRNQERTEQAKR